MKPNPEHSPLAPIPAPRLLLVAHGSPAAETRLDFEDLLRTWREIRPELSIEAAFLSVGKPSVDEALELLADQSQAEILVQPLLVFRGRHLLVDLPKSIADFSRRHPEIRIQMGLPLGLWPGFTQYLAQGLPFPPQ